MYGGMACFAPKPEPDSLKGGGGLRPLITSASGRGFFLPRNTCPIRNNLRVLKSYFCRADSTGRDTVTYEIIKVVQRPGRRPRPLNRFPAVHLIGDLHS
jgi:hypothetical protein